VRVTAGDLVQLGEVISGGSYLSQNDLRLHFGLGSYAHLDRAEFLWPDGKKEVITNLAADRYYVVRESQGIVSDSKPQELANLRLGSKNVEIRRGPDSAR
jgi:hypothetical protein